MNESRPNKIQISRLTSLSLKEAAGKSMVGKRLPLDLYIHISARDDLPDLFQDILMVAADNLSGHSFNAIKLNLNTPVVSLLHYPDFDDIAHPALHESTRVDLLNNRRISRIFAHHANRPIIHRKEMFVSARYPHRATFERLSASEIDAGLLGNPGIGFEKQWENLLRARGFRIVGHQLITR